MKKTQLAVAIWASLLSGCGTVCNLASGNPAVPFGGVQRDFSVLNTSKSTESPGSGGAAFLFLVLSAELSLSAVGDIVTLPLAVCLHHTDGYDSVDGHGDDCSPSSAAPQVSGSPEESP
jgi:uncharacterized protein YceK